MSEESIEVNRREAMRGISFPRKLWLLVNSDEQGIVNWAPNGVNINLDSTALEEYLITSENIFQTRNVHNFMRQLLLYDFKNISRSGRNTFADESSELYVFRNEFFKRDKPHLLENIVRVSSSISSKNGVSVDQWRVLHAPKTKFRKRCGMRTDACQQIVSKNSHTRLQQARIRLRTLLSFKKLDLMINNKVSSCDDGSGGNVAIELPADLFENAADSASSFEQTDVAGYYGNIGRSSIQKFFGDYLPTYSNDDGTMAVTTMEVEIEDNILEENSSTPAQPENPILQPDVPNPPIPNFHIIPSESNDSLNPYTIKMIDNPKSYEVAASIDVEPTPLNSVGQFTAIHYDIGDSEPHVVGEPRTTKRNPKRIQARSNKDEYILSTFDGNSNDSDSDDFDIDKWLVLHDDESIQHDDETDSTGDIPYSLENPFLIVSEPLEILNEDNDDVVIQNLAGITQNDDDEVTESDDFFAQIHEINDDVVIQNPDGIRQNNDDEVTDSDDFFAQIHEDNDDVVIQNPDGISQYDDEVTDSDDFFAQFRQSMDIFYGEIL